MFYALRADEDAVRAVQVLDHGVVAIRDDLRVMARDELAANLEIVVRRAADDCTADLEIVLGDELILEQHVKPRERQVDLAVLAGELVALLLADALRELYPLELLGGRLHQVFVD